ncbi:2,3-diketo-5-methylthio-1-phosphopentane phosphatase [Hortaea werneckii]|nr:2,3-diketo-5-methylthio-1-phosphopentane phosphatase [Hortaea werneckii]KAI6869852.1 2,3-diketo-5-methylthio-1-phosphopentane phosphatase [Hortaea werneckii]KAI7176409.1 2,3-diketo-5-methylthio-1-phosphopentane phosphatase [Hortaea werneckii]KAI7346717.1 2,3-diketo-5-methylthio-1-phosphopentane phosphatase [Hortaea werneckii]KAI7567504.1 2,3-diketo-5-methylthio-1-phosphopentane phosphatase [Hortaea werneckii]
MAAIQNILLDIEGTVCPISFVKDTLFPYAIKALPDVLARKWADADFQPYKDAFPAEHRTSPAALQAHVEDLTRRDVKVAYLKNLQGYLWEDGYKTGAYATPLFPDVAPKLQAWKDGGKKVAIYSSGSVFAQKLLFQHVSEGERVEDRTGLIDGWFDTVNAGLKTESASYQTIIAALGWTAETTLFLTDNVKEVDAAAAAGIQTILVDRPGNAVLDDSDRQRLQIVTTFSALEA